jgi:chain length determinant protein EpsF
MTIRQLLLILKARLWLGLIVAALLYAGVVAFTLLTPRQFSGVATVLADPKAPDPIYGMSVTNGLLGSAYIKTLVDIATSERVGLNVVRSLGIAQNPAARARWQEAGGKGTVEQYYVNLLARSLDVRPAKESNVIVFLFKSADPEFAATLANSYAQAFVTTVSDLRAQQGKTSSEFFDERTKQLRENYETEQSKLSKFQQEHGITATDERTDIEASRLSEISTQLTQIEAARMDSASRNKQAIGGLTSSPDVSQNAVVETLRGDVAQAEAKLHELSQRYGVNHPEYQAAAATLNALRSRLQIEMNHVAATVGGANAVNLQRESELRNQLALQKKKVLQLRAEHDQVAVMQRDVEEAQKAYELASQRLFQTSLESLNQQSTVLVLSKAVAPTEPSWPLVSRSLILGGFLSLALGALLALIREASDRRVRSIVDITNEHGLVVLASLPRAGGRRARLGSSRRPTRKLQYGT